MAHTSGCQQSTELTLPPHPANPADLNGLVRFSKKFKILILRVCHHISTGLYKYLP
jgi:hypothetical protein